MRKLTLYHLATLALLQCIVVIALSPPSLAQEWALRVKPRGTVRVVDLSHPSASVIANYAEGLVNLDKDNKWGAELAEDWRWLDERTVEFKLRQGVTFHNGEKFNAEAVRVNWEEYRKMESPRPHRFLVPPDETRLEIIDEYRVRFIFPQPDGLAFVKFKVFKLIAPAFFAKHGFDENNWGYLPEAGPWGTGPFKLAEGNLRFGRPSKRIVLAAYEDYWDKRYPMMQTVIFDNTLIGDREEAMRLCRATEGEVDIVSNIRPLDTLKVAESPFAKVVKSNDFTAFYGWFNQRRTRSKWRDVRLRRALNYAINREELWKYCAKGNAYNLGGFIPAGAFGHNPDLNLYTYNTDKARQLLADAGYPDGFDLKIIAPEGWKLETQIISKMLERIGLRTSFDILTTPEWMQKTYLPSLDKPPEEQEWDISFWRIGDWFGHTGSTFLAYGLIEESDWIWIEHNPLYEQLWQDLHKTTDRQNQGRKIQQMVKYLYDQAYLLFIYSPLTLYAVNKELNFVPQKSIWLRLKESSVTGSHWSLRGQRE